MKTNKIKEFVKEHHETIINGAFIATMAFAVGHTVGYNRCKNEVNIALTMMCLANPGFRETYNTAVEVTKNSIGI